MMDSPGDASLRSQLEKHQNAAEELHLTMYDVLPYSGVACASLGHALWQTRVDTCLPADIAQ